jgi:hypothetical protein
MVHDLTPEVMGWDLSDLMWQEKHYAIKQASAYIAVSKNTIQDLLTFFPEISPESITLAYNGVSNNFFSEKSEKITDFKLKYGIAKPYFLLIGSRRRTKNAILFFQAFAQLATKSGFDIICTGSNTLLEVQYREYTVGSTVHMLQLNDNELRAAYSGAIALVYPSQYEGFGLPIVEAMACGCPVITCPNSSIPEVAGDAVLYVKDNDINGLANALCDVQKPIIRQSLIVAGLEQVKKFSWSKMAQQVSSALVKATQLNFNLNEHNLVIFPDWFQGESSLEAELKDVLKFIANYQQENSITLLIDTTGIAEEDANLFLSGVALNLLMEEDLDISDHLEISLLNNLSKIQWENLLPTLQGRIVLENENKEAIAAAKAESLPIYS